MDNERPIDPVVVHLIDGTTRKLLLSMAGFKRALKRYGAESLADMQKGIESDSGAGLLFEALPKEERDKGEEAFFELLPAHIPTVAKIAAQLLGVSLPEPQSPIRANPGTVQ